MYECSSSLELLKDDRVHYVVYVLKIVTLSAAVN